MAMVDRHLDPLPWPLKRVKQKRSPGWATA